MRGTDGRNQHHQNEQHVAKQSALDSEHLTAKLLKEKINEFLAQDQNKQRNILGELLFPMVEKLCVDIKDDGIAPKVTGMLIDLEVFEVTEILEFIENEESLKERVKEAVELLTAENNE